VIKDLPIRAKKVNCNKFDMMVMAKSLGLSYDKFIRDLEAVSYNNNDKVIGKINDILDEAKMKIQKLIETDGVDRDQEWRDKIEAKIKEYTIDGYTTEVATVLEQILEEK